MLQILVILVSACAPQAVVGSPRPPSAPAAALASTTPPVRSAPPSESTGPLPTAVPTPSLPPTNAAPTALRFVDRLHGWIGTDDGILGTADGGSTWERQLASGSITKIWAYDRTRAWALAGLSALYRTQDGRHWTSVAQLPFPLIIDLDVYSPDLVFAIGVAPAPDGPAPAARFGNVLRSEDGGGSWQTVGTHTMWSVCFDTPADGIGAEGKQVYRTADGGRTWLPLAVLAITDDGPWYPTLGCPSGTNDRVQVVGGYAALTHIPYLVFRTTDAGRTWNLEFREGYTLGTTTPPNTPQLGTRPSFFGAMAGGRTWFITCSPGAAALEFVLLGPTGDALARGAVPIPDCARSGQVIDQSNVVAISGGPTPTVVLTDDGGRTWRRIYPAVVRS